MAWVPGYGKPLSLVASGPNSDDLDWTRGFFEAPQFWGLQGSASMQGKKLLVTVVNPSVSESRETEISLQGAKAESGTVTTLTNADIHACNTFAKRNTVVPRTAELRIGGQTLVHTVSPASVSTLEIQLT